MTTSSRPLSFPFTSFYALLFPPISFPHYINFPPYTFLSSNLIFILLPSHFLSFFLHLDNIQCTGANLVAAVRADAIAQNPKGNPNGDYFALHIRRGDFQYKVSVVITRYLFIVVMFHFWSFSNFSSPSQQIINKFLGPVTTIASLEYLSVGHSPLHHFYFISHIFNKYEGFFCKKHLHVCNLVLTLYLFFPSINSILILFLFHSRPLCILF